MLTLRELKKQRVRLQKEYEKAITAEVPNLKEANERLQQIDLIDQLIFRCRLKAGEFKKVA